MASTRDITQSIDDIKLLIQHEQYAEAEIAATSLIKSQPQADIGYYLRAEVRLNLGNLDKARDDVYEALGINLDTNSNSSKSYEILARIAEKEMDEKSSYMMANAALTKNPNLVEARAVRDTFDCMRGLERSSLSTPSTFFNELRNAGVKRGFDQVYDDDSFEASPVKRIRTKAQTPDNQINNDENKISPFHSK